MNEPLFKSMIVEIFYKEVSKFTIFRKVVHRLTINNIEQVLQI